ncbi:hypothetical protein ACI2KR_08185 [Pseudomonas luteola]
MRFVFLAVVFLLTAEVANAGLIKKSIAAVAVGETALFGERLLIKAAVSGVGLQRAVGVASKLSQTKIGQTAVISALSGYVISGVNTYQGKNALTILENSGTIDEKEKNLLLLEGINFDQHVKTLSAEADILDQQNKRLCANKDLIYKSDLDLGPRQGSFPVKEYDFGSYKFLKSIEKDNDDLEHDHIPSALAVLKYLNARDNVKLIRATGPGRNVTNNASSVEFQTDLHKSGRTWGKRNAKTSTVDAQDLRLATIKDFAWYFYDKKTIDKAALTAFINIYVRNKELCLYK